MSFRFDYKNTAYNGLPTFEQCVDSLSRRLDDANAAIEHYQNEVIKLKDAAYKDKELAEMQEKYDMLFADYRRGFPMTAKEAEKANTWVRDHNNTKHNGATHGAVGGGYEYRFYPTGIGIFGEVVCTSCGEKCEFQSP